MLSPILLIITSIMLLVVSIELKKTKESEREAHLLVSKLTSKEEYRKKLKETKTKVKLEKEVVFSGKDYKEMSICPECGESAECIEKYYAGNECITRRFACKCFCHFVVRQIKGECE